MLKLKELLPENVDNDILLDISRELKNKLQFRTLIIRTTSTGLESPYRLAKIRNDRKLRDTSEFMNIFMMKIGKMLNKYVPDRKQSLFATNSIRIASEYKGIGGKYTVVFPGKKSKVIYNEKYFDSYKVTDSIGFSTGGIKKIAEFPGFKKYIINLGLHEYYKLIFDVLYQFVLNKISEDELKNIIDNKINFSKLNSEIKILGENLDAISDKIIFLINDQIEAFQNAISYIKELKFLKKNDYISDADKKVEFIIYGPDEYLQVDYDLFIENFEWDGNQWKMKTEI